MEVEILTGQLYEVLYDAAILAAPPLLLATLFGFITSLLQAITQIQDQSLPQTVKIISISLTLMLVGSLLSVPLFSASERLFAGFPEMVR